MVDRERDGSLQTALWKCWIIGLPGRCTQLYSAEEEATKLHSSVSPDPRAQWYCYGFGRTVAVPTGEARLTDILVSPVLALHHRQFASYHYTG